MLRTSARPRTLNITIASCYTDTSLRRIFLIKKPLVILRMAVDDETCVCRVIAFAPSTSLNAYIIRGVTNFADWGSTVHEAVPLFR